MTTSTTMDQAQLARAAIQSLLDGAAPNGIAPESCGPWATVVQALYAAHASGGTAQVRQTFAALARAHRDLARLVAGGDTLHGADETPADHCPALPPAAIVPESVGAAPWLDAYIAHSRHWSPRSFEDYHENVGLWILATVAARRVVAHLGKPRYTPLCIALAARSSLYAKTTAAELGIELLHAAGLDWLMTIDTVTPQKFIQDRTRRVPEGYERMPPDAQLRSRLTLAFAGQRGWWYDEFGMLVGSMSRSGSVMADFSGLLRRFDECAPSYRHGTVGRGADEIVAPYVSLLAALTPADLRPVMRRGASGWTNGLWPRWAFVCPPEGTYRTDRFPTGARRTPTALIEQLRDWHEDLGVPAVQIGDTGDGFQAQVGPLPTRVFDIAPAVWDAYYTYSDALLTIVADSQVDELDSWYARLHDRVLRVALLLAAVSGSARIEPGHWARAQAIGERWRQSIHRLYQQVNANQEATAQATAEEAVLEVIQRLGNPTVRDIKTRIAWLSRSEIQVIADQLVQTGVLFAAPTSHSNRYALTDQQKGEDEEMKN